MEIIISETSVWQWIWIFDEQVAWSKSQVFNLSENPIISDNDRTIINNSTRIKKLQECNCERVSQG